ncbi:AraC-type DNA-binding protein [Paenibacillus algorifonticola]|uniref:AraC-type DNA-binding protein n=1 Tax=Paenibacillus algorifonticola TaxID=684063 RepID=A0A1I2AWW0_9BACL|nr:AraC family transcriptional regulator [Paenibacillus algorifonticola]SFE48451.1 AraC-type DNA-binding protein [Paenibacillus algorifonticola]
MFFHDLKLETELIIEHRIDNLVEHELHMHDFLEINVLLQNESRFQLLDREYTGDAGDVFLFRPYAPHYNLAKDAEKPIEWIMVLFSPSIVRLIPNGYRLLFPFYTEEACPHIPASSEYAKGIQAAARAAYEEQEKKEPGWESVQFMRFIDILVHVFRYAVSCSAGQGERAQEVDEGVAPVVEHILRHITEDIDVRELIEMYGRGKTYFYTHFKQAVGVTPNQFIHRLRLQIAMHLLKTTSKSITDIAFECGYNSIHYFNKHFKQYSEVSPREFRKVAKQAM